MTLSMADGRVNNLPVMQNAYAGYVDQSGIGVTFPDIVARFPGAYHLSISVHGAAAMCGDVENGALSSWVGYTYGYCSLSRAQALINQFGRPKKLWVAHYTNVPHICTPACGLGFEDYADGTQYSDNGGLYDSSLLRDDFFVISPVEDNMLAFAETYQTGVVVIDAHLKTKRQFTDPASFYAWAAAFKSANGVIVSNSGITAEQINYIPYAT